MTDTAAGTCTQPSKLALATKDLAQFLATHGLDAAQLPGTLGPGYEGLYSQFPASVRAALPQLSAAQHVAVRLFFLHEDVAVDEAQEIFGELATALLDTGLLTTGAASDTVKSDFDLRQITPVTGTHHAGWVLSDRDASMDANFIPGSNHVPGIGQASYSLLAATPTTPVDSLLDLGCGSGVLSLAFAHTAAHITATDISQRALELAEASSVASGVKLELLQGSWFEPVAGRHFDRIVANPPFVIGPPEIHHVYRDSGMALDGATEYLVRNAADYLTVGGHAHILGSWALKDGENAAEKLGSWVAPEGVSAWFGQRSRVSVQQYVHTWLEDESIDPRSSNGQAKSTQWLEYFAAHEITEIALGFIALERLVDESEPSEVNVQEINGRDSFFGTEVAEYFTRAQWLRTVEPAEVFASTYFLRPTAKLHTIQKLSHEGMQLEDARLQRHDGIYYSQECPEHVQAILGGVAHGTMSLGEAIRMFAHATGVAEAELQSIVLPYVVRMVSLGLLLPASLISSTD
ncbi:MAG: class I SAM-dependent methyltransferase [Corynebacterium sp.]|nr:class I SAM-dependent methyltransferase [Corynebacterium sp.]